MKFNENIFLLYAITNFNSLDNENSVKEKIINAIHGGVTCIQLREKNLSQNDFFDRALLIKRICDENNIVFIINDNVKIARNSNSDGVHVGQNDLDARYVRKLIGHNKILGVSVQSVDQAIEAESNSADYLGVGSIFTTSTKSDADMVSIETLKKICHSVSIPVVAIGGINCNNVYKLKNTGIKGLAISSFIFSSNNIEKRCREVLYYSKKIVNGKE